MEIREIKGESLKEYLNLLDSVAESSGKEGEPDYNPLEGQSLGPIEPRFKTLLNCCKKEVGTSGWVKIWGCFIDNNLAGVARLDGGSIPANMHRAELTMAVRKDFRGKGVGKTVLAHLLSWARNSDLIEWIDLGVFETNVRAYSLYKNSGFKENGKVEDKFRVYGKPTTLVNMSFRAK